MKALIVYAHPREESFSKALRDTVHQSLLEKGYEVTVRDLYAMNFDPILPGDDMIHVEEGEFVRRNSDFPADVKLEQQYMLDSDLYVYIFPIWWNGMPAIMKGYIDRVFQHGFAYSFEDETLKERFLGKKALFFTPTGQPQSLGDEDTEITKAIKLLTSQWLFNGNEVEVVDHVFYGRTPYLSREALSEYLQDAQSRIEKL